MNKKINSEELVRVEIRDELKPVIMEELASYARRPDGNEFALHLSFDPDGVLRIGHLMRFELVDALDIANDAVFSNDYLVAIEDLVGTSIFAVPPSVVSKCQ